MFVKETGWIQNPAFLVLALSGLAITIVYQTIDRLLSNYPVGKSKSNRRKSTVGFMVLNALYA